MQEETSFFWNVADVVAPSIVIGQIIGRWGNFLFMTQKIMQLVNIPMTKKQKITFDVSGRGTFIMEKVEYKDGKNKWGNQ